MNYCIANKGLQVFAWVIMSNHIHLIVSVKDEPGNLSNVIRDFKKYTSRKFRLAMQTIGESRREWILKAMNNEALRSGRATNYKLWRDDNHAVQIDGYRIKIDERLHYIHENPVKNGIVEKAWEYIYSSARDYEVNRKGLVKIEFA